MTIAWKVVHDFILGCLLGVVLSSPVIIGATYANHLTTLDHLEERLARIEAHTR